jgi:ribosomal protein L32E
VESLANVAHSRASGKRSQAAGRIEGWRRPTGIGTSFSKGLSENVASKQIGVKKDNEARGRKSKLSPPATLPKHA